jgi:hypothetical protein
MVQGARAALQRTSDLVEVALRSNPDRDDDEVAELKKTLRKPLIEAPKSHAPLFGADDAFKAGPPVAKAEPKGEQWEIIWALGEVLRSRPSQSLRGPFRLEGAALADSRVTETSRLSCWRSSLGWPPGPGRGREYGSSIPDVVTPLDSNFSSARFYGQRFS